MAGTLTFHNKFHRANHHSLSSLDTLDSGLDPIATIDYPFLGIFYNVLTNQARTFSIETNSFDWWSAYTTVRDFSATWMLTRTYYSTTSSLSDNWNLGYRAYLYLQANSANFENTYATVCSFSAEWGSPYLMFTNKAQEYTHSKTFSGVDLKINPVYPGLSTINWDLNLEQVAFIRVNQNLFITNPKEDTIFQGGLYTLVFKQDNTLVAGNGYTVDFDTAYRFSNRLSYSENSKAVHLGLSAITIIHFIAINGLMYGDVTYLSGYR